MVVKWISLPVLVHPDKLLLIIIVHIIGMQTWTYHLLLYLKGQGHSCLGSADFYAVLNAFSMKTLIIVDTAFCGGVQKDRFTFWNRKLIYVSI